jgi:glycosyltransferase involved in cell wall biosynthesis
MEMKSCLITNSGINKTSGGGVVGFNLLASLGKCTKVARVLSTDLPDGATDYSINPIHYGYNQTEPWKNSPFLMDYFAETLLPDDADLFVFYGDPFNQTVQKIRDRYMSKIVSDLAPHNISLSREEHLANGAQYPYPHLTEKLLWSWYSHHLKQSDVVITHSKISADYIKNQAGLSNNPVCIPHGCYVPDSIPPLPEVFTPGYFGAFGFDKGVQHLMAAWIGFISPDKATLHLAGNKGLNLMENIKNLFTIYDFVPDIGDFYKNINVGIYPSVTEGFGIPALECMSYGRPIITTPGCGVSELITDGKEGFIIPIRDPKAIREKMLYFIDNPVEIKRMGAEARKTATNYSWETVQDAYITIYKELLQYDR